MKLGFHKLLCALLGAISAPVAAFGDELIAQFERTCISTLPDFAEAGHTLDGTGYENAGEQHWFRESDGVSIMVKSTSDRLVCMLGSAGDHAKQFERALYSLLNNGGLGRFEKKPFQGRNLYLVEGPKGTAMLEVVPPLGASTFLVANARRE